MSTSVVRVYDDVVSCRNSLDITPFIGRVIFAVRFRIRVRHTESMYIIILLILIGITIIIIIIILIINDNNTVLYETDIIVLLCVVRK